MAELIIDFETLGQSVMKCPILNCSMFVFDRERFKSKTNPYTYDEILKNCVTLKLNVGEQVKNGYKIEPGTLDFWSKVNDEAKKQLVPSKNDLTYAEFCDKMMQYLQLEKITYWWSRSNTFDPILLWRIFEDASKLDDLNSKLKFWKIRDVRTYIDAKTDFSLGKNGFVPIDLHTWSEKFKEHDSRHDITGDILRLQKITRIEEGLDED